MSTMPPTARLSDYPDITISNQAFNGSWMCGAVETCDEDMASVKCFRFLPKAEKATISDPQFKSGKITVTSYVEGRSGPIVHLDSTKEKIKAAIKDIKENDFSQTFAFRQFSVNLTMGAFSSVFVSAAALATSLSVLTF